MAWRLASQYLAARGSSHDAALAAWSDTHRGLKRRRACTTPGPERARAPEEEAAATASLTPVSMALALLLPLGAVKSRGSSGACDNQSLDSTAKETQERTCSKRLAARVPGEFASNPTTAVSLTQVPAVFAAAVPPAASALPGVGEPSVTAMPLLLRGWLCLNSQQKQWW
eukprot:2481104-Lingulodinium_polyedra.AAC.1